MTGDDGLKINAVIIPKEKFNFSKILLPENYRGFLLTAYLTLAVISGIVVFSFSENQIISEYAEVFREFIEGASSKSEFQILLSLLRNSLPYILIVSFLSISALGDIIICIVSFIKFAGYGAFATFLYTQYGISGIKYIFYIFMPGKLVFIIALLLLIDVCIKSSGLIREKNRLPSHENSNLVIKLGITFILILLSLLIDTFTVKSFSASTGINLLF